MCKEEYAVLFRVKNLTFLGVMEDAPLLFSAAFRVSFSGKGLRLLLLGKGRYFKEGKGESERGIRDGAGFSEKFFGRILYFFAVNS